MDSNSVQADDFLGGNIYESTDWQKLCVTARQKKGAKRALAILEASERNFDWEAAHDVVSSLLARCADEYPLPPLIDRFLEQHWRLYLERLYLVEGPEGRTWRNGLEATVTLIWSVQPKSDEESRKRLYTLLPQLYQWLYAGLEMIGMPATDADEFFSELSQLNLASIYPQTRVAAPPAPSVAAPPAPSVAAPPAPSVAATPAPSVAAPSAPSVAAPSAPSVAAPPAPSKEPHPPVVNGVSVENHRESTDEIQKTAKSADQRSTQRHSDQEPTATEAGQDPLAEMHIGSRVQFQSARETTRVMSLKWISGSRSVFVFVDHYTDHELCITSTRLSHRFSDHSAFTLN